MSDKVIEEAPKYCSNIRVCIENNKQGVLLMLMYETFVLGRFYISTEKAEGLRDILTMTLDEIKELKDESK